MGAEWHCEPRTPASLASQLGAGVFRTWLLKNDRKMGEAAESVFPPHFPELCQPRQPSTTGRVVNAGFSSGVLQLVLRINAIYEARRGKKRVKRLSQSTESNSGKGRHLSGPPFWAVLLTRI